jgi:uncharacterized phage infection (PIP) family protein YhgE
MLGRRFARLAILAVMAVPALAGCGGDDETSSADWANDVCTELSTWTTEVQEAVGALSGGGIPDEDDVQTAVERVTDATSELADNLQALGPPETEAGQEAKSQLDELASQLEQQADAAGEALESDGGAVQTVQAVATALTAAATALQSAFNSLQQLDAGGELEEAFESADSCDELREQGNDGS